MSKAIETHISGIKCDTPECDYRDDTVTFADYKDWINKPCPKCGANLLTQEDHEAAEAVVRFAAEVNTIVDLLGVEPESAEDAPHVHIRMNTNGAGALAIDHVVLTPPKTDMH